MLTRTFRFPFGDRLGWTLPPGERPRTNIDTPLNKHSAKPRLQGIFTCPLFSLRLDHEVNGDHGASGRPHVIGLVQIGVALVVPVIRRCHAMDLAELAGHLLGVRKAHGGSDLRDAFPA